MGSALVVAFGALLWVRRVSRRFDAMVESYWQVRYECGQLRARVARLEATSATVPESLDVPDMPDLAKTSFVSLSSLKR